MWVDPDDDPRETDVESVDERSTLVEFLRRYRLTLEMKCAGLDPQQLARRSVQPSTMSLLGLIRHMAEVERSWFQRAMAGQDVPKLYCTDEDAMATGTGPCRTALPSTRHGGHGAPRSGLRTTSLVRRPISE
jgi:hypothetical protein